MKTARMQHPQAHPKTGNLEGAENTADSILEVIGSGAR